VNLADSEEEKPRHEIPDENHFYVESLNNKQMLGHIKQRFPQWEPRPPEGREALVSELMV
jgi:hypothetical protein